MTLKWPEGSGITEEIIFVRKTGSTMQDLIDALESKMGWKYVRHVLASSTLWVDFDLGDGTLINIYSNVSINDSDPLKSVLSDYVRHPMDNNSFIVSSVDCPFLTRVKTFNGNDLLFNRKSINGTDYNILSDIGMITSDTNRTDKIITCLSDVYNGDASAYVVQKKYGTTTSLKVQYLSGSFDSNSFILLPMAYDEGIVKDLYFAAYAPGTVNSNSIYCLQKDDHVFLLRTRDHSNYQMAVQII